MADIIFILTLLNNGLAINKSTVTTSLCVDGVVIFLLLCIYRFKRPKHKELEEFEDDSHPIPPPAVSPIEVTPVITAENPPGV